MGKSNFDLSTYCRTVPEFYGIPEKCNKFVSSVDKLYGTLNEEGIKKFNLYYGIKLAGKAFDFYNKSPDGKWENFRKELIFRFGEMSSISILRSELMAQEPTEYRKVGCRSARYPQYVSGNSKGVFSKPAENISFSRKMVGQKNRRIMTTEMGTVVID